MREVSIDIECGNSFDEVAYKLNQRWDGKADSQTVFKTRLEEAYFVYQLRIFFGTDMSFSRTQSNRIDLESVCKAACENIFADEGKWLSHRCDISGCSEGFVMCDGNAKITRCICAADRSAVKLARYMPNVVTVCPNSPLWRAK